MTDQLIILIVDDSATDQSIYRRFLERDTRYTYHIVEAATGKQALELYQQETPDLVLLDYRLPDCDGLEVLEQMKRQSGKEQLPVTMVTGQGNETIAVQTIKSGAQEYIVKSRLTAETLCRTVQNIVSQNRLRQQIEQQQEQQRLVNAIALHIRQSLQLDSILNTTVHDVRAFLKADRVVVYQFAPDMSGTITAECVLPGWSTCWNVAIEDTCFRERAGGAYREGKSRAIANIREAELTHCHIQMLERFQVKANLVVPIVLEQGNGGKENKARELPPSSPPSLADPSHLTPHTSPPTDPTPHTPHPTPPSSPPSSQLWGLLVAHQCATPREWLPTEVELMEQLAVQLAIAIKQAELYQGLEIRVAERTAELQKTNDRLQTELFQRERVERALKLSDSRFKGILEIANDAIISVNAAQQINLFNQGAEKIFGYTTEEVLGQPLDLLLPERLAAQSPLPQLAQGISKARSRSDRQEIVGQRKDGTEFPAEASISRLKIGTESIFTVFLREISERRQAEAALQESEARYRAIVEDQTELITRFLPDGTIQFVNDAFCRYFGVQQAEIIGQSYVPHVYEADRESVNQLVQTMSIAQPSVIIENRVVNHQGELRWMQWVNRMLFDPQGNFLEFQSVGRDVTELKQAEQAIHDSEERLQLALEASGDGLWDWNIAADQIYFSPRWLEMLGYTADELPQNFGMWEQLMHPDDVALVKEHLKAHLCDSLVPYAFDYRLRTKVGDWKWIADYGKVVVRDANGKPLRMTGTNRDISDRKQVQLELQRAKDVAEIANQTKSVFLANMSHELRTPLNVILGFAQVMGHDTSLNLEQQENLLTIHRSGDHLLNLINDILDLSKIEAGRITLEESSVDLYALLHSLGDMFRQRVETKGLKLDIAIATNVPAYITTDPNKLRQILINLVGNAIKFTDQGSVTLRVKRDKGRGELLLPPSLLPPLSSLLPHPSRLVFEVEDTGIGIASDDTTKIFDAFTQTHASRTTLEGTGLGLTISHRFVQLMGGTLTVTSTIGQGSCFQVKLPIALVTVIDLPHVSVQQQVVGLAPDQPAYRILVVDDQAENRHLLVRLLTKVGLEVRSATGGEQAVRIWQQWQPHLIWMDIQMPEVDGYEATQEIRSNHNGQKPIIIALTAQASSSDRTLALSSGCNDFLSKPFREETLFAKMATHLGLRYIYGDDVPFAEANRKQTEAAMPVTLTPESLSMMPMEWITDLQHAALNCDDEEILTLIEAIPSEHTTLIAGLANLAHQYDFKALKALT